MTTTLATRGASGRSVAGLGVAAWIALASVVGWMWFDASHCLDYTIVWPTRGHELLCGSGTFPYEPVFLTFVLAGFAGLVLVVRSWGEPRRGWWLAPAAILPFVAYGVLRVVVVALG